MKKDDHQANIVIPEKSKIHVIYDLIFEYRIVSEKLIRQIVRTW